MAPMAIDFLNKGLYTVAEASRLIGVDPQWSWRVLRGREQKKNPVFTADFRPTSREDGFVSFLDMVELLFIHRFRKHGVSMQTIRRAAANARTLFKNEEHPFCVKRFVTDGAAVLADFDDNADSPLLDMKTMQQAFKRVVRPFLKDFDYGADGTLLKWYPAGRRAPIVIDPRVNFGRAFIREKGVPVEVIARARAAGDDVKTIADWFNLRPAEVRSALGFDEQRLAA